MAAVYSVRFVALRNTSGGGVVVPAGNVAIVRDIDAFFGGGIGGGALNVTGPAGQTFAWFPFTGLESSVFQWRGRQVFNPGETIGWTADHGVDLTISGYLLTLP